MTGAEFGRRGGVEGGIDRGNGQVGLRGTIAGLLVNLADIFKESL